MRGTDQFNGPLNLDMHELSNHWTVNAFIGTFPALHSVFHFTSLNIYILQFDKKNALYNLEKDILQFEKQILSFGVDNCDCGVKRQVCDMKYTNV